MKAKTTKPNSMAELNEWEGQDGGPRAGLNVAAWKVEPLGLIGKRKPKPKKQAKQASASDWQAPLDRTNGRNELNDELPW